MQKFSIDHPHSELIICGCSILIYEPVSIHLEIKDFGKDIESEITLKGLRVFLHGAGNDGKFDNELLFESWLNQGFRIISIQLPGHGKQGTSLLTMHTALTILTSVFSSLSPYIDNIPIHQRILVGESLGGVFAILFLHENKENQSQFTYFHQIHLLAYPIESNFSAWGIFWELCYFFGYFYWKKLRYTTWKKALPAIGPFNRRQYPVRTQNVKPLVLYKEYIRRGKTALSLVLNDKASPLIIFYQGRLDGLTPLKKLDMYLKELKLPKKIPIIKLWASHTSIKNGYVKIKTKL